MDSAGRFTGLALDAGTVDSLEAVLPQMAERTVAAVIADGLREADTVSR